MSGKYRWSSPLRWLEWKADREGRTWCANQFLYVVRSKHLDNDAIQDLFQRDMDKDGYFDVSCPRCHCFNTMTIELFAGYLCEECGDCGLTWDIRQGVG